MNNNEMMLLALLVTILVAAILILADIAKLNRKLTDLATMLGELWDWLKGED